MKQIIHRIALIFAAASLLAVVALAQNADKHSGADHTDQSVVVGTWDMTSETPDGNLNWKLVVKQDQAGALTATRKTSEGDEATVRQFAVKGAEVKFQVPYQEQYYDVDLRLTGDKLDGTWSGNGSSGRTYGTKAP